MHISFRAAVTRLFKKRYAGAYLSVSVLMSTPLPISRDCGAPSPACRPPGLLCLAHAGADTCFRVIRPMLQAKRDTCYSAPGGQV
ncbi:unnamed protein product [Ectocarpus sp. 6 AP-2014]